MSQNMSVLCSVLMWQSILDRRRLLHIQHMKTVNGSRRRQQQLFIVVVLGCRWVFCGWYEPNLWYKLQTHYPAVFLYLLACIFMNPADFASIISYN